ncbi:MAG: Carboxypeptidase regulatory-like domain [Acidobacteriota bacterium]|nr:Carboxypeptidase regulatory-like domain [Acidobacteriota bacterium]
MSMPLTAATVKGTVTIDRVPLAGVVVTLDSNRTTVTDANGAFAFDNVPAGSRVVRAELAGLKMARKPKPLKVTHDQDLQVAIAMKLAQRIETVTVGCSREREEGAVFTMSKSGADKLPIGH